MLPASGFVCSVAGAAAWQAGAWQACAVAAAALWTHYGGPSEAEPQLAFGYLSNTTLVMGPSRSQTPAFLAASTLPLLMWLYSCASSLKPVHHAGRAQCGVAQLCLGHAHRLAATGGPARYPSASCTAVPDYPHSTMQQPRNARAPTCVSQQQRAMLRQHHRRLNEKGGSQQLALQLALQLGGQRVHAWCRGGGNRASS